MRSTVWTLWRWKTLTRLVMTIIMRRMVMTKDQDQEMEDINQVSDNNDNEDGGDE